MPLARTIPAVKFGHPSTQTILLHVLTRSTYVVDRASARTMVTVPLVCMAALVSLSISTQILWCRPPRRTTRLSISVKAQVPDCALQTRLHSMRLPVLVAGLMTPIFTAHYVHRKQHQWNHYNWLLHNSIELPTTDARCKVPSPHQRF